MLHFIHRALKQNRGGEGEWVVHSFSPLLLVRPSILQYNPHLRTCLPYHHQDQEAEAKANTDCITTKSSPLAKTTDKQIDTCLPWTSQHHYHRSHLRLTKKSLTPATTAFTQASGPFVLPFAARPAPVAPPPRLLLLVVVAYPDAGPGAWLTLVESGEPPEGKRGVSEERREGERERERERERRAHTQVQYERYQRKERKVLDIDLRDT